LLALYPFTSDAYLPDPIRKFIRTNDFINNLFENQNLDNVRILEQNMYDFKIIPDIETHFERPVPVPSYQQRRKFEEALEAREAHWPSISTSKRYQTMTISELQAEASARGFTEKALIALAKQRGLYHVASEDYALLGIGTPEIYYAFLKAWSLVEAGPNNLAPTRSAPKKRRSPVALILAKAEESNVVPSGTSSDFDVEGKEKTSKTKKPQKTESRPMLEPSLEDQKRVEEAQQLATIAAAQEAREKAEEERKVRHELKSQPHLEPDPATPPFQAELHTDETYTEEEDKEAKSLPEYTTSESNESIVYVVRVLFDPHFRAVEGVNRERFWKELKKALKTLSTTGYREQSEGVRFENKSGVGATIHRPHGRELGYDLLSHWKGKFEKLGWTPESLGILLSSDR
jgi:hypothetical protein